MTTWKNTQELYEKYREEIEELKAETKKLQSRYVTSGTGYAKSNLSGKDGKIYIGADTGTTMTSVSTNSTWTLDIHGQCVNKDDYIDLVEIVTYLLLKHYDGSLEVLEAELEEANYDDWRVLTKDVGRGVTKRQRYVAIPPEVRLEDIDTEDEDHIAF